MGKKSSRSTRAKARASGQSYTRQLRQDRTTAAGPEDPASPGGDDRHKHAGFEFPHEPASPYGIPGMIDTGPLGLLMGAAFDKCLPCQDIALDQLAGNPAAATRLVEILGTTMQETLGGLPGNMTDDDAYRADANHPALRATFRAFLDGAGEYEVNRQAGYEVIAVLSPAERRAMCDNVTDTLIGLLATKGKF